MLIALVPVILVRMPLTPYRMNMIPSSIAVVIPPPGELFQMFFRAMYSLSVIY